MTENGASKNNHHPPVRLPRFLIAWTLVNTLLVPFAFPLALFVMFILSFMGHPEPGSGEASPAIWFRTLLGFLIIGGTAGAAIGAAQWLAIRKLNIVRFWIPATIAGFTLGIMITDITRVNWIFGIDAHWLVSLILTWILPALLAALFQTIVLFHGGVRAYLWPIVGALPMLLAGTGYSIDILSAFPAGFLAAIISAIVLWVVLRKKQQQYISDNDENN
jgi:hypothetical protein